MMTLRRRCRMASAAAEGYPSPAPYAPASARGIRWDDPAIGIAWPAPVVLVSERDRSWPLLDSAGVEP
ncbi:MAG: dTDP-4-dehydrorhamnose 3,5-epimerase [Pirellulales bacterium]|nr:dTDP-4-dehydrorhamnose 3,5-epimerase [Pirellulales bacterium]